MKILLVSRGVFPVPVRTGAGAEAHMYNIANAIAELGHEVHYVANTSGETKFHKNIILHETKTSKILASRSFYAWAFCHASGNVKSFREALKTVKNEAHDFDVIHGHGNLSSLLLSYVKGRTPVIYTVHDTPPYSCSYGSMKETVIHNASFSLIDLVTWRRMDHLIAVSKNLKMEIMKKGIPSGKISAVYNGVSVEFLQENDAATSRRVLQEKYGIANSFCLYVGRLDWRKGLDYLLYALRATDLKCVIVGDGPEREHLFALAKAFDLHDRVIFAGFVPQHDLKHFYVAADFFVLPSLAEGLPLVVLEALGSGCPVIASNVAGTPEIVSDGYNGLIVPPRNAKILSKAIQELTRNPELRRKMGQNARHTVNANFTWGSVAKRVLKVYDEVCAQRVQPKQIQESF